MKEGTHNLRWPMDNGGSQRIAQSEALLLREGHKRDICLQLNAKLFPYLNCKL